MPEYSYYIVFAFIAVISFFNTAKINVSKSKFLFITIALLLILFAGLRPTSADYDNYVVMFYKAKDNNWNLNPDKGYVLLNIILAKVFDTPTVIFLVMAALSVSINLQCYRQYTRYYFIAILYYFIFTYILREMAQIRAGLACAICLYNIKNIIENRKQKFLFLQIIAVSMHLAAIFFLAAPIIKKLNFSRRALFLFLILCLTIGLIYPFGRFIQLLPLNNYTTRALSYIKSVDNYDAGILTNPTILKQLLLSVICLIFYNRLNTKIQNFNLLLALYILGSCWYMIFHDFAIIAGRISTFWTIGEPVLVSALLYIVKPVSRPVISLMLIVFCLIYLMLTMVRLEGVVFNLAA